jgi:integrase
VLNARASLTVEGALAKRRQTRHVPLNDEAMSVLKQWREQVTGAQRVFQVQTGFKSAWSPLLGRATSRVALVRVYQACTADAA